MPSIQAEINEDSNPYSKASFDKLFDTKESPASLAEVDVDLKKPKSTRQTSNQSSESTLTSTTSISTFTTSSFGTCPVHKNCKKKHRYIVSHHYRDHANDMEICSSKIQHTKSKKGKGGGRKVETFPSKLYRLLEDASKQDQEDIIQWLPHGRAFLVLSPHRLVDELLGRYGLHQSKYVSFQRQLNLYGFERLTGEEDKGAYYNEFFLRGRHHLLDKIKRVRVKGVGVKGAIDRSSEPNFYRMPFLPGDISYDSIESSFHSNTNCCDIPQSEDDIEDSLYGEAAIVSPMAVSKKVRFGATPSGEKGGRVDTKREVVIQSADDFDDILPIIEPEPIPIAKESNRREISWSSHSNYSTESHLQGSTSIDSSPSLQSFIQMQAEEPKSLQLLGSLLKDDDDDSIPVKHMNTCNTPSKEIPVDTPMVSSRSISQPYHKVIRSSPVLSRGLSDRSTQEFLDFMGISSKDLDISKEDYSKMDDFL